MSTNGQKPAPSAAPSAASAEPSPEERAKKAEACILGYVLKHRLIPQIAARALRPKHFSPDNAFIWDVMRVASDEGEVITVEGIGKRLEKLGIRDDDSGYLRSLLGLQELKPATAFDVVAAVRTLATKDGRGYGVRPIGDIVDAAIGEMMRRTTGEERPIPLPWRSVNGLIRGGLWPGFYTVTSLTGAGKTQWATQTAVAAARTFAAARPGEWGHGERVRYIALELGPTDMVARALPELAGPSDDGGRFLRWSDLFYGQDPKGLEWAYGLTKEELRALPLDIDIADAVGWTHEDFAAIAEEARPPRLLILDYTQLVCAPKHLYTRREDLRETIGAVAKIGRDLARQHGIAVLAICSTARDNYAKLRLDDDEEDDAPKGKGGGGKHKSAKPAKKRRRDDGSPNVNPSTLVGMGKESGELEFTADVVLVLAPEEAEPPQPKDCEKCHGSGRWTGERGGERDCHRCHGSGKVRPRPSAQTVWLAIAKGRGFGTGWAELQFDGFRFTEPGAKSRQRAQGWQDR